MIKVIIAEDELLVRLGLVSSVDWMAYGFEIVGEVSNGVDAWALCEKYDPHLVITDIRMPQMDGLELIRKLKEAGKKAKVVIISCYEDFSYAREALELGVVNYLLKADITPGKLVELLVDLKAQYWGDKETDADRSSAKRSWEYERFAFLEDVFFARVINIGEIKSGLGKYELNLSDTNYFTCVARINLGSDNAQAAYNKKQLLTDAVKGVLEDCISRFGVGAVLPHSPEEIILQVAFPQSKSQKMVRESADEFFQFIRSSIKRCLGLNLMLGVSNVHNGYENLSRSCQEANKAIEMHFFLGQDRIIYYDALVSGESADTTLPEVNAYFVRIVDAINQDDREKVVRIFDELKQVFSRRPFNHQDSKWFFTCLIFKYFDQIRLLNMNDASIWGNDEYPDVRISKMNTLDELIEYLKSMTFSMMKHILGIRDHEKNLIVSRAQRYIEDNYAREITLQEISDYLNINSTYFCKLFGQIMGETFVDYLTKIRIEHARHYLSNTSFKIYEISEKIGYNSPEYFCRAFRKSVGISPLQFRASVQNDRYSVK